MFAFRLHWRLDCGECCFSDAIQRILLIFVFLDKYCETTIFPRSYVLRRTLGVVPCPVPAMGHSASPATAQLQAPLVSAGFWPLDLLNALALTKHSVSRWYLSLLSDLVAMDGDGRWSEVTRSLTDVLTLKCPHCGIAVGKTTCFSMRFAVFLHFPSFSFVFLCFPSFSDSA